jgi:hypothetical protein
MNHIPELNETNINKPTPIIMMKFGKAIAEAIIATNEIMQLNMIRFSAFTSIIRKKRCLS